MRSYTKDQDYIDDIKNSLIILSQHEHFAGFILEVKTAFDKDLANPDHTISFHFYRFLSCVARHIEDNTKVSQQEIMSAFCMTKNENINNHYLLYIELFKIIINNFNFDLNGLLDTEEFKAGEINNSMLNYLIAFERYNQANWLVTDLRNYINVNIKDSLGQTALILLSKMPSGKQLELADSLILAGADLSAVDYHGRTALHYAASLGLNDLIIKFREKYTAIQFNLTLAIQDKNGHTAYDIAINNAAKLEQGEGHLLEHEIKQSLNSVEIASNRSCNAINSYFRFPGKNESVFARSPWVELENENPYEMIMPCDCCQGASPGNYALLMHPTGGFKDFEKILEELVLEKNQMKLFIIFNGKHYVIKEHEVAQIKEILESLDKTTLLQKCIRGVNCCIPLLQPIKPHASARDGMFYHPPVASDNIPEGEPRLTHDT